MKKQNILLLVFCCFVLALAGCAAPLSKKPVTTGSAAKTHPDQVPERAIVLSHPPSGERLNLTYYKNNRYDPAALTKINRLFRDRQNNSIGKIDPELIDFLVDIRTRLGLPPSVTFEILDGYRSRSTNEKLRARNSQAAKDSLHIYGWAVDFRISKVNGRAVAEIAKTMQRGGVSYYPSSNHIHIDLGNIRTWKTK
ncbi:MAG: DUF882 domain-containing protein [Alphaproteobacteria bacterium]|nr:DUF882 domain-containing protein [Alphaproteobacteria bacterium]